MAFARLCLVECSHSVGGEGRGMGGMIPNDCTGTYFWEFELIKGNGHSYWRAQLSALLKFMWPQTVFHRMLQTSHRVSMSQVHLWGKDELELSHTNILPRKEGVSYQNWSALRMQNSTLHRWYKYNQSRKLELWAHSAIDFHLEWLSSRQKGPVTREDTS